jgi:hypothetical protein
MGWLMTGWRRAEALLFELCLDGSASPEQQLTEWKKWTSKLRDCFKCILSTKHLD